MMEMDKTTKDILIASTINKCLTQEQIEILTKRWVELGGYEVKEWYVFLLENTEIEVKIK